MAQQYDVIIIGSGPGGYVAGIRAGQLGLKVAVVERDPFFGGTCLHRGCIPTKALLHTATVLEEIREAGELGIGVGAPELDLGKAQERKQSVVDKNARGIAGLFKKYKVDGIQGTGRIAGAGKVEVTHEGETTPYETKNILIATGSLPREIPIAKVDGERIINSDHILKIGRVPQTLAVLGAGAVGTEFASMFASFGSKVTVIEMLDRLLPVEDAEVSKEIERAFRKRGIQSMTGTKLAGVETTEGGVKLSFDGSDKTVEAEVLLVAVGRGPYTEGLGLESVGIETERGFIATDGMMRTSAEGVYAIGDVVAAPPWLAHKASAEGIVAVEHMAGHETRPIDYTKVPSVVFTTPEVGSVGLSEQAAREAGYDVAVGKFPFTALGKAAIEGKTAGFVKIVRDTKYDEVLGVHIVGLHATDLIAEACAALQLEATAEELFRAVHAHPTLAEAMAEAAHASHGSAIHF
ncbi:MAG TPA: dihydrolipoyl dehydrogenase [Thermoanaerobaculia bacterium]|nr:dihydrolipoyl dehydrogenase [Thermoanaerobaculia bacterium]